MFKIMSISAGWIMGEISDDKEKHFFDYSYLTNFPDDLMKALLYVNGDWAWDEFCNKFRAELEPAVEDWELLVSQGVLTINIKTYEFEHSKEISEEKTLTVNFDKFLDSFVAEMERILNFYGLIGYRENWSYEFPLSLYLKLKNISQGREELEIAEKLAEEHFGTNAVVSNYSKEIELLKK